MKAFIVDDEILSVDLLKVTINTHCRELDIVGEATNINIAYDAITKSNPEIIFLDIEMPGGDGFELLEKLNNQFQFHTVFITAHEQYARHAIRAGAVDYLLKPLEGSELKQTVQRLLSIKESRRLNPWTPVEGELEKKIVLNHHKGYSLIKLKDIIDLKADNNYTVLTQTDGTKIVCSQTLGKFETGIQSDWFFRTHRSHIINLYHLQGFLYADGGYVQMSNGVKISVADNRVKLLKEKIDSFCLYPF